MADFAGGAGSGCGCFAGVVVVPWFGLALLSTGSLEEAEGLGRPDALLVEVSMPAARAQAVVTTMAIALRWLGARLRAGDGSVVTLVVAEQKEIETLMTAAGMQGSLRDRRGSDVGG